MFWNDIKDIKDCVNRINDRISRIERELSEVKRIQEDQDGYASIIIRLDEMAESISEINNLKCNALCEETCDKNPEIPKKKGKSGKKTTLHQ